MFATTTNNSKERYINKNHDKKTVLDDTIPLKWTIEIHKVFNYSRRWDFLCLEKANIYLNKSYGQSNNT